MCPLYYQQREKEELFIFMGALGTVVVVVVVQLSGNDISPPARLE
jgi:hypothetical protein